MNINKYFITSILLWPFIWLLTMKIITSFKSYIINPHAGGIAILLSPIMGFDCIFSSDCWNVKDEMFRVFTLPFLIFWVGLLTIITIFIILKRRNRIQ